MIYDQDCFIDNPYFVRDGLTEEDCNNCKILKSIKRIANANQSEIAENHLFTDVPVIVTDAIEDWGAVKTFDINFLAEVVFGIIYFTDFSCT